MSFKAKTVTISDRTFKGHQSWNREIIEKIADSNKVRMVVKCDAYAVQSYATAEVWRADGWKQIHQIPGEVLASRVSYISRDVQPSAFDADIAELRRVALAVLS